MTGPGAAGDAEREAAWLTYARFQKPRPNREDFINGYNAGWQAAHDSRPLGQESSTMPRGGDEL